MIGIRGRLRISIRMRLRLKLLLIRVGIGALHACVVLHTVPRLRHVSWSYTPPCPTLVHKQHPELPQGALSPAPYRAGWPPLRQDAEVTVRV